MPTRTEREGGTLKPENQGLSIRKREIETRSVAPLESARYCFGMVAEPPPDPIGSDLVAAIDATGVPATIKGKVQRALLRFIAGGVGYEAWREIRENLDTIEGRSRVNMMLAEHVGRQAIADPEIVERAKARFLGDLGRKQENVEAVALLAYNMAAAAPDAEEAVAENAPEPSQDWMNAFTREAENASSDDLRQRLAGVLAGEARKPGTFSRSTVRFISDVDKEILEAFQEALRLRMIPDAVLIEESWKLGDWFARGSMLEHAGLISGVSGTTFKYWKLNDAGNAILPCDKLALMIMGPPAHEIRAYCWLLTKLGMEVASLLPSADEMTATQHTANALPKGGLDSVWIGRLVRKADGQIEGAQQIMVAWDKAAAT